MANLKNDFHLTDAFRELYLMKQDFTFNGHNFTFNGHNFTFNGHNLSSRLDKFTVNFFEMIYETFVKTIPCTFSDPDFVLLQLRDPVKDKHGPGYCKCNVNVLNVADFKILWGELNAVNPKNSQWWEECKINFKSLIIRHSKRLSRLARKQMEGLESEIRLFQELERSSPGYYKDIFACLEEEMNVMLKSKLTGVRIRSKADPISDVETAAARSASTSSETRVVLAAIDLETSAQSDSITDADASSGHLSQYACS